MKSFKWQINIEYFSVVISEVQIKSKVRYPLNQIRKPSIKIKTISRHDDTDL